MTTIRTITRPAMLAKTGLSRTSAYLLERAGDFPAHFMLTPRCAVWYEHQIDEWLEGRRQTALPSAVGPDHTKRTRFPGRGETKSGKTNSGKVRMQKPGMSVPQRADGLATQEPPRDSGAAA